MIPYEAGLVLGAIAAVALTILLYIKVMPRKRDGKFGSPITQMLHDFMHFKKLYLEEFLKFLYVLITVATVCIGTFMLLSYYEDYYWGYYSSYSNKESLFGYGLLMIFVGPIAVRLVYEVSMMFILLVKNVIEINNKLSKTTQDTQEPARELVQETIQTPEVSLSHVNTCANCGSELEDGTIFCPSCGYKV